MSLAQHSHASTMRGIPHDEMVAFLDHYIQWRQGIDTQVHPSLDSFLSVPNLSDADKAAMQALVLTVNETSHGPARGSRVGVRRL